MNKLLNELKEVFDSNEDVNLSPYLLHIKADVEGLILAQELSELSGLDAPHPIRSNFEFFGDYQSLMKFGNDSLCEISWEDKGRVPEDGWYSSYPFPAGAYTLNSGYPKSTFDKFFQELKDYGADYCDTRNSALFFNLNTNSQAVKKLNEVFPTLFKKYYDLAEQEMLEAQIKKAEEDLDKLRGGSRL